MTKQHAFTAAMALSVLLLTGPAVAGQASHVGNLANRQS